MGLMPAGMSRNREYVGALCTIDEGVPLELADIIFDPQTSGGLLISLPEGDAEKLLSHLHREGMEDARIIATVQESASPRIRVI